MKSALFSLTGNDFLKGLVMAVLTGFAVPVVMLVQTPGFDLATVNWPGVLNLAINSGIAGFVSYLAKNFMSDEEGKVFGKIG